MASTTSKILKVGLVAIVGVVVQATTPQNADGQSDVGATKNKDGVKPSDTFTTLTEAPSALEWTKNVVVQPSIADPLDANKVNDKLLRNTTDDIYTLGGEFAAIKKWADAEGEFASDATSEFVAPNSEEDMYFTSGSNVLYEKETVTDPTVIGGYGVQGSLHAIVHNHSMTNSALPEKTSSFKLSPATGNVRFYELQKVVSKDYWDKIKIQYDGSGTGKLTAKSLDDTNGSDAQNLVPMIMTWQPTNPNGEFVEKAQNQIIICMETETIQQNEVDVPNANNNGNTVVADLMEMHFDGSLKGYMPKAGDTSRNYANGWKVPSYREFETAINDHNAAIVFTPRAMQQKGIVTKQGGYISSHDDQQPVLRAAVENELSFNAQPITMKRQLFTYKMLTVIGWKQDAATNQNTVPIFATMMYVAGALRFVTATQAKSASADSCSSFNVFFGVMASPVIQYVSNPQFNGSIDILYGTPKERYNQEVLPEFNKDGYMIREAPYVATYNKRDSDIKFTYHSNEIKTILQEANVEIANKRPFLDRNVVPVSIDNRNNLLKPMQVLVWERLTYCSNFIVGPNTFRKLSTGQQEAIRRALFEDPFATMTYAENQQGKTCIRSPQHKLVTNITAKVGCDFNTEIRRTENANFARYSYVTTEELEHYNAQERNDEVESQRRKSGFPTALHGPADPPYVNPTDTFYVSYEGYSGLNNSTCNADGDLKGCQIRCPRMEMQSIAMGGTCGTGVSDLGPKAPSKSKVCNSLMDLAEIEGPDEFCVSRKCANTQKSLVGHAWALPQESQYNSDSSQKLGSRLSKIRTIRGPRTLVYSTSSHHFQYKPQTCETQCCGDCVYVLAYLSRVCEYAKPLAPCGSNCPQAAPERMLQPFEEANYVDDGLANNMVSLLSKLSSHHHRSTDSGSDNDA